MTGFGVVETEEEDETEKLFADRQLEVEARVQRRPQHHRADRDPLVDRLATGLMTIDALRKSRRRATESESRS